jgi:hypothetical protein
MMCKFLLIAIPILLFVGPTRRWFFAGAWRLIVPLIGGILIGMPIAQKFLARGGAPREVQIILPLFACALMAAFIKEVIDEIMKPPKR